LKDFIAQRLPFFGDLQDAMWQDEPWLFHSLLSLPLNLRLLNPREVVEAAIAAYHQGGVPLNALEGFVRQIVGWREYVRGLYWTYRDEWPEMNALHAEADLPSFYWTGKSEMQCMAQSIGQVLAHGYGHHIQRLMVTGLFALLYGVKPQAIHHWYLGMYVDAFAWVEMPNTLGMSQFADGGRVGSKPYIASGAYIDRMSNYCKGCRYQVKQLDAPNACPFNLLYWQFIERHQDWLKSHPRLAMQVSHWQKKPSEQRAQVIEWAGAFREKVRKGDKV
jgi:deoxyribodipyrimidine photolyase-related protein